MKKLVFLILGLSLCPLTIAQDKENGHAVFELWCAPCHAPGPKHPGTQALDALYQGALPGALEERTDMSEEFVTTFVRNGVSIMPSFRKTEISDKQLNDLSVYLSANKEK